MSDSRIAAGIRVGTGGGGRHHWRRDWTRAPTWSGAAAVHLRWSRGAREDRRRGNPFCERRRRSHDGCVRDHRVGCVLHSCRCAATRTSLARRRDRVRRDRVERLRVRCALHSRVEQRRVCWAARSECSSSACSRSLSWQVCDLPDRAFRSTEPPRSDHWSIGTPSACTQYVS